LIKVVTNLGEKSYTVAVRNTIILNNGGIFCTGEAELDAEANEVSENSHSAVYSEGKARLRLRRNSLRRMPLECGLWRGARER